MIVHIAPSIAQHRKSVVLVYAELKFLDSRTSLPSITIFVKIRLSIIQDTFFTFFTFAILSCFAKFLALKVEERGVLKPKFERKK